VRTNSLLTSTPPPFPSSQPSERAGRRRARARLGLLGAAALAASFLLGACGQNFHSDGGTLPVPRASTEGLRRETPAPATDQPAGVQPVYAPPRTSGPTQTAAPNVPGGEGEAVRDK
jgi:hypothetical protein